jgi:uncharacterized protein (DUF779 family)
MDKFICIKKRLLINLGDIYLLDKMENTEASFVYHQSGGVLDIISDNIITEYFITIAEWREKQIKTILDD